MKYLKQITEHICYIWFAGVFVVLFLLVFPFMYLFMLRKEWHPYTHFIRQKGLRLCLFIGGLRVKQIFETPLQKGTYVITPNHTSKLDMMVMPAHLPVSFVYMGREDFMHIPLFGQFLKKMDIPVDVKNKTKAVAAYRKALKYLAEGMTVAIFPEGTISRNTPILSNFKDGAFRLAIESQADILPITSIGHWDALSDFKKFRFKPTTVIQYVHAPISTKGLSLSDVSALKQKVFGIIANKLESHGYQQRINR
jgi:1-acyl-sn-glycerol-3-phosphate acyltransferase